MAEANQPRTLIITDCGECPHFGDIDDEGVNYAYCRRGDSFFDSDDDIPVWCPLPSAKMMGADDVIYKIIKEEGIEKAKQRFDQAVKKISEEGAEG